MNHKNIELEDPTVATTQLREAESGFRYTPTSTFETFPLPWEPGSEPASDPRIEHIGAAARDLVAKRDAWLAPSGATESELKNRTLTRLYNQSPEWLEDVHRKLDAAVLAAYGWPASISENQIIERLLFLNLERSTTAKRKRQTFATGITKKPARGTA